MYGKPTVQVIKGRYVGKYLTSDKSGSSYAINGIPIERRTVAAFKLVKIYPMYFYGTLPGILSCIKWRDGTKSYFIISRDTGLRICKSLENK
jgi:hypothetical protein